MFCSQPAGVFVYFAGAGMQQVMSLAQQLQSSRTAASADVAHKQASHAKRAKNAKKARASSDGAVPAAVKPPKGKQAAQKAALAAALRKRQQKKAGERGGLVVIPGAFGRDTHAPDALSALRLRMRALDQP